MHCFHHLFFPFECDMSKYAFEVNVRYKSRIYIAKMKDYKRHTEKVFDLKIELRFELTDNTNLESKSYMKIQSIL